MDDFPKLVNSHDDSTVTINNSSFSIGRSLSCDHIIESLQVSRFHCIIKKNNNKWTLFDRSTNGTFVNSRLYKFNESVDLRDGDVIKLGSSKADFIFTKPKENTSASQSGAALPRKETNDDAANSANFTKPSPPPDDTSGGSDTTLEGTCPANPPTLFPNDDVIFEEAASLLAESLEEPRECAEASTDEAEHTSRNEKRPNEEKPSQSFDIMNDDELTCSICSELFVKAVTLNCSHTFCKFCIEEWKKNKSSCPICRKFITTAAPTLVLDNFIEKIINKQEEEVKEARKALVQQREEMVVVTAGSSSNVTSTVTVEGNSIVEIFSDDDDDDDDSDYSYFSDDHDYEVYDCYFENGNVGSRRRSYGGYGRCFICGQPGHWANSCPFKRR